MHVSLSSNGHEKTKETSKYKKIVNFKMEVMNNKYRVTLLLFGSNSR